MAKYSFSARRYSLSSSGTPWVPRVLLQFPWYSLSSSGTFWVPEVGFEFIRYSLSSSGLRKTFGRSGNPVRSSATASDRTSLTVIVHRRTATSRSRVDSRPDIAMYVLPAPRTLSLNYTATDHNWSHVIDAQQQQQQQQQLLLLVLLLLLHSFKCLFSRTTWASRYYQSGFKWCKILWGLGAAVASAAPDANSLHLAPHQHLTAQFLQAGCSSWRPANNVKALNDIINAQIQHYY